MPLHLPGTRELKATVGLLQLIALLGLAAAIAAMAIPGPASEVTGVAAILALGALALLAGHTWGAVIVTAADLVVVAKLWPVVFLSGSSPTLSASIAFGLALPGLLLFAMTLPNTVETVIGRTGNAATDRLVQGALGLGGGVYLVLPAFGLG